MDLKTSIIRIVGPTRVDLQSPFLSIEGLMVMEFFGEEATSNGAISD